MLQIKKLNKLLNLLDLQIELINGLLHVHNFNSNSTALIKRNSDNKYEYSFVKDEIKYHLSFNETSFKLTNDLSESITIDATNFEYCKRLRSIDRNEALVTISPSIISFYRLKTLDDTEEEYYSISTKAQTARDLFLFYKKAETFGKDGTFKKDSTISYEDEEAVKTDYIRYYNTQGQLSDSTNPESTILEDMDEYIIADLASQEHVRILLERINELIPSIGESLVYTNPNLFPVIKRITDITKKKQ